MSHMSTKDEGNAKEFALWKVQTNLLRTTARVNQCTHSKLRAATGGGIECDCGMFVPELALKRIGSLPYDRERMRLADECGRLRQENTTLLAENATLRRKVERGRK